MTMTELFGKKLKALRTAKKISQKEFGKRFGLAESTIGMYERDERRPDFELLNKFADFFDVSTDYLLGRTDTIALTPQEVNTHLSHKQQEVLNFLLERENLFFEDKPEDIIEALDQFEIYYEVWKKQQNKKTKD